MMNLADTVQSTSFTKDVLGRYICNSFKEALDSTRGGDSPFHFIVIGGGTFGGALASFLMNLDKGSAAPDGDPYRRYHSRVLLLEAGPFVLPEHEQNLPHIGVGVPSRAVTLAELRASASGGTVPPQNEVWGLPWHSDDGFNGLAYCLGGRSLFWGGWAPRYLASEMPVSGPSPALWPKAVVDDLAADNDALWTFAAHQIGADDPNDFVNGELHSELREIYFKAHKAKAIRHMVPITELPDYVRKDKRVPLPVDPLALRLDAPYAVQTSTRSGFFPSNKFSTLPLIAAAARRAASESSRGPDPARNDSRKQLMVVPNCHVIRLQTLPVGSDRADLRRVVGVETGNGVIPVAHNAVVVLASAAIESARLALNSFAATRGYGEIGQNLMVHLRTNTQFRVPRSLPLFKGLTWAQLEVSAIQLRGRIDHADGTQGHFHLQIVASGVRKGEGSAEVEFFQKIPDLDQVDLFASTSDDEVAIAIRGIGEVSPMNPGSRVELDPETDEYGARRAFVRINDDLNRDVAAIRNLNAKDAAVLQAMAEATNDVMALFSVPPRSVNSDADVNEFQVIKLDGVGTTYHEAGTLRMGDDPDHSVLDIHQRFHGVTNAYATDMSVLPSCGSANPVQPGIALTRRLAEHLALARGVVIPPSGLYLFKDIPTAHWRLAGAPGTCVDFGFGDLEVRSASGPFGLYWCTIPTPPDFELTLDWMASGASDNSGVFIRFPDPDLPPPLPAGERKQALANPGEIASRFGFEVQIDNLEGGDSPRDGSGNVTEQVAAAFRGTGAIYNESSQTLSDVGRLDPGRWHSFRIVAKGNSIAVDVRKDGDANYRPRSRFTYNRDAYPPNDPRAEAGRGLPTDLQEGAAGKRYIGLQSHDRTMLVRFKNIFIKPL